MIYKKSTIIAIISAFAFAIISNITFAATGVSSNDQIIDGTLQVLIFIQKYSWPVLTLLFIFALYKFYIAGTEVLDSKVVGQRLIVSIAIFMVIVQALPLIYALITVK